MGFWMIKKSTFFLVFTLLSFLWVEFANAQVLVDFVPDPLFSEVNYLPGDMVEGRYAVIKNTGTEVVDLGLSINNMTGELSQAVQMSIFSDLDNSLVWAGTLSQLANNQVVTLGKLVPNEEKKFNFIAEFLPSADNSYQSSYLSFDIIIGSLNSLSIASYGGGSSVYPSVPVDLVIFNEGIGSITQGGQFFNVPIFWQTNLGADALVVFGLKNEGPFDLSLDSDNYGYSSTSGWFLGANTNHSILLEKLPIGVYVYRVFSRRGDSLVSSTEKEFTITDEGELLSEGLVLGEFIERNSHTDLGKPVTGVKGLVLGMSLGLGQKTTEIDSSLGFSSKSDSFFLGAKLQNPSVDTSGEFGQCTYQNNFGWWLALLLLGVGLVGWLFGGYYSLLVATLVSLIWSLLWYDWFYCWWRVWLWLALIFGFIWFYFYVFKKVRKSKVK